MLTKYGSGTGSTDRRLRQILALGDEIPMID